MATQIIDKYIDHAEYVPTSSIDVVRISTTESKVRVSLYCEDGTGGDPETFFTAELYASGNEVRLTGVGAIIEEYFRRQGWAVGTVSIFAGADSIEFLALYCEDTQPTPFDYQNTFLLASKTQRVFDDSRITIAAADHPAFNSGNSALCWVRGVGLDADGHIVMGQLKAYLSLNNAQRSHVLLMKSYKDWLRGQGIVDLKYFGVEYGNVQKMFFVRPQGPHYEFSFRNRFNVEEFIYVVGEVTTKTEASRDIAVCAGKSLQYDRRVTRSYHVTTEALTPDEVALYEQFLTSYRVCIWLDGDDIDVLITDFTCEPSTSDGALTVMKFTWQFADGRPRDFRSGFDGVDDPRTGVFTDTFSSQYA